MLILCPLFFLIYNTIIMRNLFIAVLAITVLFGCKCDQQKVMARYVPERADDFVWENENIIYRAYGTALEGETLSPGFDVWVKKGGKLVADDWYKGALEDPDYYHYDRGEGKDCYKVAKSLGGGASAPFIEGALIFPTHNYSSYEIVSSTPTETSFILHYPEWEAGGHKVTLDKKITVRAGTNFCEVEDIYSGDFESMPIAAGIIRHNIIEEVSGPDYFAIWEEPSDVSKEPENSHIGLSIIMPRAEKVLLKEGPANHSVLIRTVKPNEPLKYFFGSCWSKGNVPTYDKWFEMVNNAR